MDVDDDKDAERLLAAVRAVRRATRPINEAFSREALTGAQAELLRLLRRTPGVGVGEAARSLALAPNTVSTLVRQLVDLDHVVRKPDPDDARAARLYLTAATNEALTDWRDRRHAAVATALVGLDPELRRAVESTIGVLDSVAQALEEDS